MPSGRSRRGRTGEYELPIEEPAQRVYSRVWGHMRYTQLALVLCAAPLYAAVIGVRTDLTSDRLAVVYRAQASFAGEPTAVNWYESISETFVLTGGTGLADVRVEAGFQGFMRAEWAGTADAAAARVDLALLDRAYFTEARFNGGSSGAWPSHIQVPYNVPFTLHASVAYSYSGANQFQGGLVDSVVRLYGAFDRVEHVATVENPEPGTAALLAIAALMGASRRWLLACVRRRR